METARDECSDGNKGEKDKHRYSVLGCALGEQRPPSLKEKLYLNTYI